MKSRMTMAAALLAAGLALASPLAAQQAAEDEITTSPAAPGDTTGDRGPHGFGGHQGGHQGGPQVHPQLPQVHPQLPQVHPQLPQVHPQQPQVHPQLPQVHPQLPQVHPQQPQVHPQQPQQHPLPPQQHPHPPYHPQPPVPPYNPYPPQPPYNPYPAPVDHAFYRALQLQLEQALNALRYQQIGAAMNGLQRADAALSVRPGTFDQQLRAGLQRVLFQVQSAQYGQAMGQLQGLIQLVRDQANGGGQYSPYAQYYQAWYGAIDGILYALNNNDLFRARNDLQALLQQVQAQAAYVPLAQDVAQRLRFAGQQLMSPYGDYREAVQTLVETQRQLLAAQGR